MGLLCCFREVASNVSFPAILYNDKDTLWSASKASATFQQWDVASDSYSLLDSYSHPPASWNIGGELAFVDEARHPYTISRDLECVVSPRWRGRR